MLEQANLFFRNCGFHLTSFPASQVRLGTRNHPKQVDLWHFEQELKRRDVTFQKLQGVLRND